MAHRMMQLIGDMYPIPDQQIKQYLERILSSFDAERIKDLLAREYTYRDKIKGKSGHWPMSMPRKTLIHC